MQFQYGFVLFIYWYFLIIYIIADKFNYLLLKDYLKAKTYIIFLVN
jgi:hypothetical protein